VSGEAGSGGQGAHVQPSPVRPVVSGVGGNAQRLPAYNGPVGARYALTTPTLSALSPAPTVGVVEATSLAPPPREKGPPWAALSGLALIVLACCLLLIEPRAVLPEADNERML
jgi:hypothetical protein